MIKATTNQENIVSVELEGSARTLANEIATVMEVFFERTNYNGKRTFYSFLALATIAMKKVLDGKATDMDEAKNIAAAEIMQDALDGMVGKESKEDDQSQD